MICYSRTCGERPMDTAMMIKICGLTDPSEAEYLNRNKVDLAGMVLFFPKSKRNISIEQSLAIRAALDPSICTVAVTVSPSVDEVLAIQEAGFDLLQVHGELSPEVLADTQVPIIRAFNVNNMSAYESLRGNDRIRGYLFDAQVPGSGKTFDWSLVTELPRDGKPVLLAGGLGPDNVAEAIRILRPDGVDVSSGVENESGIGKDGHKVDRFSEAARQAAEE